MKEFASYIADTWNLREPISKEICESFEKGDAPLYLADYRPSIAAEADIGQLWSIHGFLTDAEALSPQKKRLINALKKSGKLTDELQNRITLSLNPFELDDMLLPERPNPRSKAQIALKKGLGPLAERIRLQEDEGIAPEELAAPLVGTEPSLKTVDDVLDGVGDILAERFAYDETARTMVRDFAYDDGYFEVTPKDKKDPALGRFTGKSLDIKSMSDDDILMLLYQEENKAVRLKLGVQLFRIGELLKHHFIVNPDAAAFDLICRAIDDCWLRLLQPIIERDVKLRLGKEAQERALSSIAKALEEKFKGQKGEGVYISIGVFDQKNLSLAAFRADGRLLGASLDKKPLPDKPAHSERLRQFCARYKPSAVIVADDEAGRQLEAVIKRSIDPREGAVGIVPCKVTAKTLDLAQSGWMKASFSDLNEAMRKAFALGICCVQPFSLIPKIGIRYFPLHPLQGYVPEQRLCETADRILARKRLHEGVPVNELDESAARMLPALPEAMAKEIAAAGAKKTLGSKNDLLKVQGMSETIFRNIAGYVVVPWAENPLDRTLVHPDHFGWVADMCSQCSLSIESVIADPESLRSYPEEDVAAKFFIENRLMAQLRVGQKYAAAAFGKPRRKLKLDELQEGTVVSGRVTNITPFGVFVNINAVCEALIHISQLADTYVESPDQVVSLNDTVNVRIIKVDLKKRRISLSMKGLGPQSAKVSPSKRQLSSLASHFQNR